MEHQFSIQSLKPETIKTLSSEEITAAQQWNARHLETVLPAEVLRSLSRELIAAFQRWAEAPDGDLSSPVPLLISWLRHHAEPSVREFAVRFLCLYHTRFRDPLTLVLPALEDPSARVRRAALAALGCFPKDTPAIVPALLNRFAREDTEDFEVIAQVAVDLGPEVIPALESALGHAVPRVRVWSARALSWFGPEAASSVPALGQALGDPNPYVRAQAAESLGKIGTRAHEAVPILQEALTDPVAAVRQSAWAALGAIEPTAQPVSPPRSNGFRLVENLRTLSLVVLGVLLVGTLTLCVLGTLFQMVMSLVD